MGELENDESDIIFGGALLIFEKSNGDVMHLRRFDEDDSHYFRLRIYDANGTFVESRFFCADSTLDLFDMTIDWFLEGN